jgi:RNA polymerase sigma-70 factor (ECF subfamily)
MTIVEPRSQLVRPAADLAAVRGDLERLYVEHGDRVRAICASILRNPQESEDAAQQVFVSALRALWSGTEPRDPGAWLATIARHESWARARCQAGIPLSEELEDVTGDDPVTTVVRRAELAHAWQTIAELPPSQRQALLLREVRGLGYDELAADLRLSHASVRSLLSRARRTLRRQLEKGAGALTGAPWLNVFARLVSDTSNPPLSSASRTAAVGFGALVLTGGAVVAPTLTPHVRTHTLARNETSDGTVHRGTTDPTVAGAAVVPEGVKLAVPSEVATRDRHAGARSGDVDAAVSTHDGGASEGARTRPDDGSRGGRSDDGAVAVPSNGSSGGSGTPSSGGAGT